MTKDVYRSGRARAFVAPPLVLLGFSAAACASTSYLPKPADARELVWTLEANRPVVTQPSTSAEISSWLWLGLSEAVACVPEAREQAERARNLRIAGESLG